jgi:hypothetical protein
MRRMAREVGFAVSAWLVPFAVSVCIFPLKKSNPPLFESLMGVVLAASTVALGCAYKRRVTGGFVAAGVRVGVVWMAANWLLDGLMFSGGPMKMSFSQYAGDIGVAYLAIPAITIGLGIAAGVSWAKAHAGIASKESFDPGKKP